MYFVIPRYLATNFTFGNDWRHHCPNCGHGLPNATPYIRNSSVPFPNAWNCLFRAMISCQATRILSPQDRITLLRGSSRALMRSGPNMWLTFKKLRQISMKLQKEDMLHLLRHMASTNTLLINLLCTGGFSIYNWNIGHRRGREDAFEKQIAKKWHIVTLIEASDYVNHDILHERFHVTRFLGCAILFNKDTFYPDITVKSTFMTQGEAWQIKSLRENRDGFYKVFFHVLRFVEQQSVVRSSLLCCPCISATSTPRRKGIAKKLIQTLRALMISQEVDLVAGDFNGMAWRFRSRDNLNTIDEAFTDCALPTPPGPTPSGQLGRRLWISQTTWFSRPFFSQTTESE